MERIKLLVFSALFALGINANADNPFQQVDGGNQPILLTQLS